MTRTTLGRYVNERRTALGLRAEDVGAAIGKSQSWVSRLETGAQKVFPEPQEIHALAAVLQVTPRELLEAEGYLSAESRGEHVLVNPFGVDDPRWAVVEALKRHPLSPDQAAELGITTGRVRQLARALGVGVLIGRDRLYAAADIAVLRARNVKPGRPPKPPRTMPP